MSSEKTKMSLQGQDEIVVDAPIGVLWTLISDSTLLPNWGPPVRKVEVIGPPGVAENVGSRRRLDAEFDGKKGYFVERRTEHVEGRMMAFIIEEESFGLFRVMTEPGSSIELEPIGPRQTRVVWKFFHKPKGIIGHVLNVLVIRRKQRTNRLAALASLKACAEKLSVADGAGLAAEGDPGG